MPLLVLLLVVSVTSILHKDHRFKRLSAYDPGNLLLPLKTNEVLPNHVRSFRPMLNVVLAETARSTKVNGRNVSLWHGDGFVRIPKRPVISTAQVVATSAEENIEVRFGGGPRPHYPYPSIPVHYPVPKIKTTTHPPVMLTLGFDHTPFPTKAYEAITTLLKPSRNSKDSFIVFKKKKPWQTKGRGPHFW